MTVPTCYSNLVIHTRTPGDFCSMASTEQAPNNFFYFNAFELWIADIGKAKWHQLNNNIEVKIEKVKQLPSA